MVTFLLPRVCHLQVMVLLVMGSRPTFGFDLASNTRPPIVSSSSSSSSSTLLSAAASSDAQGLLYQVQEDMITKRAIAEQGIMADNTNVTPLQPFKPKGAGTAGGFGGSSSQKSTAKKSGAASSKVLQAQAQQYAQVLKEDGVVCIENVLPADLCDELRSYVLDDLLGNNNNNKNHFADVLLRKNRCDLTLPLSSVVLRGLHAALVESPVGATMDILLSSTNHNAMDCELYELSCLVSQPGSDRQTIHPDTPCASKNEQPVLYTCFMALQDITIDMGPTVFLPKTHTLEMHTQFQQDDDHVLVKDGDESPKDVLLRTNPIQLGLLSKGTVAIFDSRLLHAGTANQSQTDRALFYCSFKNPTLPSAGNPGSIRPELVGQLTLGEITKDVVTYVKEYQKQQRKNKGESKGMANWKQTSKLGQLSALME